jgi:DnaJ-class molecular chaperone
MAKSYFAILGISSAASLDEVRSAYRRLAKEYHPDHFEGDSGVFRQIQEAYATLGNAERRAEYEQSLRRSSARVRRMEGPGTYPEPEPLIPEQRHFDSSLGEISPVRSFQTFTPSLDEVFDWLWHNFSSLDQPKSGRMQQLTLEVPLTREQARTGGSAKVMVPVRATCPTCRGYGGVGVYECSRCAGEGAISGEMPVSIAFPPGLFQDHAVVIPLERFGIRNLRLTVLFRPTSEDDI